MIDGLGTALITPFQPNGEVDFAALEKLLDMQISGGVDYIVVLGTTGEAVTLSEKERQEVRRFIVKHVDGRLPIVLGVGGNCTANVIEAINGMKDELQRDYAAILSVCPYYNKPSQEGLYQHFAAIAKACPIPIILYNVPGRTGVNLLPETVVRIHEACPEKVVAIKEASGNIEQIRYLIDITRDKPFDVISGDDGIAAEVMQAGGVGLISVASNAYPEAFRKIVHDKDVELQAKYAEFIKLLFKEGNPAGIKTALANKNIISNVLRLPLVANSEKVQREMRDVMLMLC
ncbi:MAG: 4-hydroxy-tetrahydrodipicolinate synthase [Paludibacteraceae bacterium]|nr:4-hydroxy-tetrahydrodipicolinate synthase [Paludibacteraceae bacterium]